MATQVIDMVTIIKALSVAEKEFLGKKCRWLPVKGNADQKFLMRLYKEFRNDVEAIKGLKALASKSAKELNTFLRKNGFDIRLNPIPVVNGVQGFAVVALFDRFMSWIEKGTEGKITVGGKIYPAFRHGYNISFHSIPKYPHTAVALETIPGDTVWITFADKEIGGVKLLKQILELSKARKNQCNERYSRVVIPEVMLDERPDISFLKGVEARDSKKDPWIVDQALQQVKFAMNKMGVRAKSATAIAIKFGSFAKYVRPPDLVFDKPFYLWITTKGSSLPIVMIYSDTDSWRKADLEAL